MPFDLIGRRQLEREVPHREVFEQVLPLTRVEQVRHHRGVALERLQLATEAVHQLLGAVDDEGRALRSFDRGERVAHLLVAEEIAGDVGRVVARRDRESGHRAPADHAGPARFHRDPVAVRRGAQRLGRGRRVARDDHVDLERVGVGCLGDVADRIEDPRQQQPELELVEQHAHPLAVERALLQIGGLRPPRSTSQFRRDISRFLNTRSLASARFVRCLGGSSSRWS